jgi:enediyne polyketide synthase
MSVPIAIVGLGCEYPGAHSPEALWETALHGWRWFRRFPRERLDPSFWQVLEGGPWTPIQGAFVTDWTAPRFSGGIPEAFWPSADLAHALALDCAGRALADWAQPIQTAGRARTRVIVGNTLTGEMSRAQLLPLSFRHFAAVCDEHGLRPANGDWAPVEQKFRERFAPLSQYTLAGALSNVIAGVIAQQFDFGGGAFCVDGACASSLVALAQACSALAAGEIDCAVAGGVDISLDPLELAGFSFAGALARGEMLIFDQDRRGFLPGEGCGFAILRRLEDALASGDRIRAVIRGWAVSSDGTHDLMRPAVAGQKRALAEAYRVAGYSIGTVGLIEAHGTGTPVGDEAEVESLKHALASGGGTGTRPGVALGSIKANIGHTKAAAGLAGVIKAVGALQSGLLPKTTGCRKPMPGLEGPGAGCLRVLGEAERWPAAAHPRRAGVNGFGFGGVNAHIALEEAPAARPVKRMARPRSAEGKRREELFIFEADDEAGLQARLAEALRQAGRLAEAELAGFAHALSQRLTGGGCRAAVIAESAGELAAGLQALLSNEQTKPTERRAVFSGRKPASARIGFLLPGHGTPFSPPGELGLRFPKAFRNGGDSGERSHEQGRLVRSSLQCAEVLLGFGIRPSFCVGHSLGEITAYALAGALPHDEAVRLADERGRIIDRQPGTEGAMLATRAAAAAVRPYLNGEGVTIAAFNGPSATVLSGPEEGITLIAKKLHRDGIASRRLPVHRAFHTVRMQPVAQELQGHARACGFTAPAIPVFSTVTGARLEERADLAEILSRQLAEPVRFVEAIAAAAAGPTTWLELGNGHVCGDLARQLTPAGDLVLSLPAESDSARPLLEMLANLFVRGHAVEWSPLYRGRDFREYNPDRPPAFLANPAECASTKAAAPRLVLPPPASPSDEPPRSAPGHGRLRKVLLDYLDGVRASRSVSPRPESPAREAGGDWHPGTTLGDLGLDSMDVFPVIAALKKELGLRLSPVRLLERTLENLLESEKSPTVAAPASNERLPEPESWIRAFSELWAPAPRVPSARRVNGIVRDGWKQVLGGRSRRRETPLASLPEQGLLVQCPPEPTPAFLCELLNELRSAPPAARVVFIDPAGTFSGFARTFALEEPSRVVRWLSPAPGAVLSPAALAMELEGPPGFRGARFAFDGARLERRWQPLPGPAGLARAAWSERDVILVTGGASGITLACVLALAKEIPARFALLGRKEEGAEPVQRALDRFGEARSRVFYFAEDLARAGEVRATLRRVRSELGEITGLIHGAGEEKPIRIAELQAGDVYQQASAKVHGLRNVLGALRLHHLRRVVAFGSIIAQTGRAGSGAYALANDWMATVVEHHRGRNPQGQWQVIDWSAWRNVGIAERGGYIAQFEREGIDPLDPRTAAALFVEEFQRPSLPARVVMTGRLPRTGTALFLGRDLPALAGEVVSHTPGVELILRQRVTTATHPMLTEHVLEDQPILPGVVALEMLAAGARALLHGAQIGAVRGVEFARPISIPVEGGCDLWLQLLHDGSGRINGRIALAGDHFKTPAVQASFVTHWEPGLETAIGESLPPPTLRPPEGTAVVADLYGKLLFHEGQSRCVTRYLRLSARETVFELGPAPARTAKGPSLWSPAELRDAIIHGIQACVPDQLLLPRHLAAMIRLRKGRPCLVWAREIAREDAGFRYDVKVYDRTHRLLELWTGLVLRTYRERDPASDELCAPLARVRAERSRANRVCKPRALPPRQRAETAAAGDEAARGFSRTFEACPAETNRLFRCQGYLRDEFIFAYAPGVLKQFGEGMRLLTHSSGCRYLAPLEAVKKVHVTMRLAALTSDSARLSFEYRAQEGHGAPAHLLAVGEQAIECRMEDGARMRRDAFPEQLRLALQRYAGRADENNPAMLEQSSLTAPLASPADHVLERRLYLETSNAVGNIYFAHFLDWQNETRLQWEEHAARMGGAALREERCTFLKSCFAGERLRVELRQSALAASGTRLRFDFWRVAEGSQPQLVAVGEQRWEAANGPHA